MPPEATAGTRVFALLGDPVEHSLSPLIQNAAFQAAGVHGHYVTQRCHPGEVHAAMRALARAGGGGNVTVPHKRLAAAAVRGTAAVQRTGACNTFWLERGELVGDNTDVVGFDRAVRELIGDPKGARVLLLGAGGGAAAALLALLEAGAAEVVVANRTRAHADELVARVGAGDPRARVGAAFGSNFHDRFDLVVNATSLGLRPHDPLPPLHEDTRAAFDLVYARHGTPWVRAARADDIPAADGLGMLIHQAAAAFERWWQRPAPIDAMRAALRAPISAR